MIPTQTEVERARCPKCGGAAVHLLHVAFLPEYVDSPRDALLIEYSTDIEGFVLIPSAPDRRHIVPYYDGSTLEVHVHWSCLGCDARFIRVMGSGSNTEYEHPDIDGTAFDGVVDLSESRGTA